MEPRFELLRLRMEKSDRPVAKGTARRSGKGIDQELRAPVRIPQILLNVCRDGARHVKEPQ